MSETQNTEAAWRSAFMNAVELVCPDAVDYAGRPVRNLTQDEDAACIAEANAQVAAG